MRLIDDHKVDMADAEAALSVTGFVNEAHHCRIGRDEDSPLGVLFGHEIHGRGVGQVALEGGHCLIHERDAIGEEQHALDPVAAHQQIAERDYRARLSGASGHHHQCLAVMVTLESFCDASDGTGLVVAFDDGEIDLSFRKALARGAPLDGELELRLLVEALDRTWWVTRVVPELMFVAVRIKDQRSLAELAIKAIGVELGLLLADACVAPGALGFDESQWLAVIPPEHVVNIADALLVGHSADLKLAIPRLIERPSGLLQQQVDEVVTGLGLGVIVRVRLCRCDLLDRSDFSAQALQFVVECRLVSQQRGEFLVALAQSRLELLQLLSGLPAHGGRLRRRARIEGQTRRRPCGSAVGAGEPVRDVEELAHRGYRIVKRNGSVPMHGPIAERIDDPRLAEHGFAGGLLEARLVDQRRQVVLVRQLQCRIVLVGLAHREFEGTPCIEACRTGIGVHGALGARSRIIDCGPLRLQKCELTHVPASPLTAPGPASLNSAM